jgi:D-xylose transport system substrate-binding protein
MWKRLLRAGICATILGLAVGCSGSTASRARGIASAPAPQFSISQITRNFSAMSTLRSLTARGKGRIAVLLPETVTTSRWAKFDAPYIARSFRDAGLKPSQFSVKLATGSNLFGDAQTAIAKGARIVIIDARDSGAGIRVESYASSKHVQVIDYDILTPGGTRNYYVGYDSLKVGVLQGQGLVSCVEAWKVKNPQIIVMKGDPTDYNSALYAKGSHAILAPHFAHGWKRVGKAAGTWEPLVALSEFRQQYMSHKNIKAALIPNDENATPIIKYLQSKGIPPRTFPVTGLDAGPNALHNILAGYQCGTVYKPIYLEAQAAATLALYLRAGITPPATLHNSNIIDPLSQASVAAVQLTPEWITAQNMKSTVIADHFETTGKLCAGAYAPDCADAGISG